MNKWTYCLVLVLLPLTAFTANHPHFEANKEFGLELPGKIHKVHFKSNQGLKIAITTRNFSEQDLQKLQKAVVILERVINGEELKNEILHFEYKGDHSFHQNNGLSNIEIFKLLMTGAELLKPEVDHTMDFDLTLYKSFNPWSKVKGYTTPDSMRIYLNTRFYRRNSWTPIDIAANLAHEWTHKMGFEHDYYDNEDRPFTVPYAIGSLISEVARK